MSVPKSLTPEQRRNFNTEHSRAWRAKNPDRFKASVASYRDKNRERIAGYFRDYRNKNSAVLSEKSRAYRIKNREALCVSKSKAWARQLASDPEGTRRRETERKRIRRERDLNFVILGRLRCRLRRAVRAQRATKAAGTLALIGCSSEFLRGYLEAKFADGMTWANVHIDHIIPCAEFDLRDPAQQKQCFHYSNLQPLFGIDNLRKGKNVPLELI